ncbi:hypothetical protein AB4Z35_25355 [Pseudomonas sp. KB_15]
MRMKTLPACASVLVSQMAIANAQTRLPPAFYPDAKAQTAGITP